MPTEKTIEKVVFKHAFQKKGKDGEVCLLRLGFPSGDPEGEWCTTTPEVFSFAKNSLKENEVFTVIIANGDSPQKHVTRITRASNEEPTKTTEAKKEPVKEADKPCEAPISTKKDYTPTSNSTTKSIERQTVIKAVAQTIEGLAGTLDPSTVVATIDVLIKKYDAYINS